MRRLFKRKWLVFLVVVIGIVVLVRMRARGPTIEPGTFLLIDVVGEYKEGPPHPFLAQLLEEQEPFVDLVSALEKARRDQRLAGVILRVGALSGGWAQVRELRDTFKRLRESGKQIIAYLENELTAGNLAFYLASGADSIYVPPGAATMLNGLAANFVFLGGLWEKLDITMEVEQLREYKTFGDTVARREMSAPHREMANSLLDDLNDEFVAGIAEGRRQAVTEIMATIDSCPSSAGEYVEAGLADRVAFFDEMLMELGKGTRAKIVRLRDYRRVPASAVGLDGEGKIALLHATGNIVGGESPRRGGLSSSVGSRTIARAFRRAVDSPDIKAIVLRIDSPGGSAMASDQVWHAVSSAREKKPVVASLGNVAASGGYYIAAGANKIVAEPGTLTGSIGVVLVKPNVAGMLGRIGIGTETLGRGRYSRLMDLTKSLDRTELALVKAQLNAVYRRFLDRVAEGRKMTVEEVDVVGGGRVWTGRQAKQRGLVDELGGLAAALRLAAELAGFKDPDRVEIVHMPEAPNPLRELLGAYRTQVVAELPPFLTDGLGGASAALSAVLEPGIYAIADTLVEVR